MSGGTYIFALVSTLIAAAQAPPASNQTIAGALVPLPQQLRADATVVRRSFVSA